VKAAAALLAVLLAGGAAAAEDGSSALLGGAYPLEASVSFSAGLFHWVDSLAGTSGGKTIPLHQSQFEERFGRPDAKDMDALRRFQAIRARGPARGANGMLGAFLEGPDLEGALRTLRPELGEVDTEGLRACLEHFRERYAQIWQDGKVPQGFLEKALQDPVRKDLAELLGRMAKFFGFDPTGGPTPRLVVVPVPQGGGTHAEAVGRNLLIEVRPLEGLADQAPPIVHENAHFLWNQVPVEKRNGITRTVGEIPYGKEALAALREALPTALGQGVAGRAFLGKRWSTSAPWYHTDEVDAYGKALYPLVQAALDTGLRFDETLAARMARAYPKPPPARVTPR